MGAVAGRDNNDPVISAWIAERRPGAQFPDAAFDPGFGVVAMLWGRPAQGRFAGEVCAGRWIRQDRDDGCSRFRRRPLSVAGSRTVRRLPRPAQRAHLYLVKHNPTTPLGEI